MSKVKDDSDFLGMVEAMLCAVTGTKSADTDAAGCVFGNRRPPETAFRWELHTHEGSLPCAGSVEARDIREVFRAWKRAAKRHPRGGFTAGLEGPAVTCGEPEPVRREGEDTAYAFCADALNGDGGSVGVLFVRRADGRSIRARKGGAA
jgi:hypothetical protein